MKNYKIAFAALIGLGLASCSLDRAPLDKNTDAKFNQDAEFTKIYATFGTSGQVGPDGDGDVDGIDEGTSAFYRMTWELNEFGTDEGWWIWNDVGLADIRTCEWTKDNTLVEGLYYRLYFDISLCNQFLALATGTDAHTQAQRAEVRMIRAINYYYLLDMFYSVPFVTTVSSDKAKPISRKDLFAWLETELKELESDPYIIPAGQRTNKYRVDQACAWFMLMRLYLNAPVYNGEMPGELDKTAERYADAELYAKKLINCEGYKLHGMTGNGENPTAVDLAYQRNDTVLYSAYQQLFMGDNDNNGAQNEAILMVYQDGNFAQCWGGARFLLNTFRDADFVPSGSNDTWSCFRTSPEFVQIWFADEKDFKDQAPSIQLNEYEMPARLGDDRAIMVSVTQKDKKMSLTGAKKAEFDASWSVVKFTGVYSKIGGVNTTPDTYVSPTGEAAWPDTDIPLFRLAEAYMTLAETSFRQGNAGKAADYINVLRDRAHAAHVTNVTSDVLLSEWSKEFYCEGRRRTDLIRFEMFTGNKTWEGHGVGVDKKYNVYPIPLSDETANENLAGINAKLGYN